MDILLLFGKSYRKTDHMVDRTGRCGPKVFEISMYFYSRFVANDMQLAVCQNCKFEISMTGRRVPSKLVHKSQFLDSRKRLSPNLPKQEPSSSKEKACQSMTQLRTTYWLRWYTVQCADEFWRFLANLSMSLLPHWGFSGSPRLDWPPQGTQRTAGCNYNEHWALNVRDVWQVDVSWGGN